MAAFRLIPAYKDYLWGGNTLASAYGKAGAPTPLAESWELSLHPDGLTRLPDGRTLADALTPRRMGENAACFSSFPLLIKLIDAASDLSVQVHPSDAYAMKHENSYGKTEMWYIVAAREGAGIYLGFRREVTEEEVRRAIASDTLTELLSFVPVRAGESYFIPAGTVHAIGAGCLIAEIQQNSNLTYRLYDYGRRDGAGNTRPLHIDKALAVLQRVPYTAPRVSLPVAEERTLGFCRYFHTALVSLRGERTIAADPSSLRALLCVRGSGTVDGAPFMAGDSLLLPAGECACVTGDGDLISVSVRRYALTEADGWLSLTDDLGRVHAKEKTDGTHPSRIRFLAALGLTEADIDT